MFKEFDPAPNRTADASKITSEEFSLEVEERAWTDKDEDSYIFHTSKLLEELGLDADQGKKLISPTLMDKIKHEAIQGSLLKERNTTSSVFSF